MPSYKPRITVYTDEETNQKLAYIAKSENRSSSNYTEYLIKKEIKSYEAEHGEIIVKKESIIEAGIRGMKEVKEEIANNPEISIIEKYKRTAIKAKEDGLNIANNIQIKSNPNE